MIFLYFRHYRKLVTYLYRIYIHFEIQVRWRAAGDGETVAEAASSAGDWAGEAEEWRAHAGTFDTGGETVTKALISAGGLDGRTRRERCDLRGKNSLHLYSYQVAFCTFSFKSIYYNILLF